MVPFSLTVTVAFCPGSIRLVSNEPSSAVAVCGTLSLFVHVASDPVNIPAAGGL
jgi:hypothetical protein